MIDAGVGTQTMDYDEDLDFTPPESPSGEIDIPFIKEF
jgi:hypothetical protein